MKLNQAITVWIICALVASVIGWTWGQYSACSEKGGVFVRGLFKFYCVDGK